MEYESKTKCKNPTKFDRNITKLADVANVLEKDSFRGDLEVNRIPFGNIDIKLYTDFDVNAKDPESEETPESILLVQSGPPFPANYEEAIKRSPFDWTSTKLAEKHGGQPPLFNFDFMNVQFAWN